MATKNLNKEEFKELVFDYTQHSEWKFEGENPAIVDFYADWCGPCKMVAPILEELSEEYQGKVDIYKVDTEAQQELASVFPDPQYSIHAFYSQGKTTHDECWSTA